MADTHSPKATRQNGPVAPTTDERWFDRILAAVGLRNNEGLRENLAQALAGGGGHADLFSAEERRLLKNILELRDVRILDVMVPRADVVAVPGTITLADLMTTFRGAGHSRLPVFGETLDDPTGFIHAKDVMIALAQEAAREDGLKLGSVDLSRTVADMKIVRPILFVPPSMPAMDLMVKMQASRIQLALVVDEYGGTDGLVSLEDLLETVVGDIEDEYDWPDEATMTKGEGGVWFADARVAVEDFASEAGLDLPETDLLDDVDTLGGIVFAILGRVPVRGELIASDDLPSLEFEVLDADPRRIKRVKVTVRDDAGPFPDDEADRTAA